MSLKLTVPISDSNFQISSNFMAATASQIKWREFDQPRVSDPTEQ